MTAKQPSSLSGKSVPHFHGHRERLRERFLQAPDALPDYEILELLLASVIPRKDVKPIAKTMLDRWGSLADILAADITDLQDTDGLGRTSATILKIVREAAIRMIRAPVLEGPVLASWDSLLDYCQAAMATLRNEHFRLLFLDRKHQLICDEVQQQGTVDHTPLYPREVVRRALELDASSVIMVHNHPTGDPTPSKADIEMTRLVQKALSTVGIKLIDHLIIGRKGHCSFTSMCLI